ncbi:MAG: cysteine desulfurase [Candidatus Calescibacterium sp.]|nr:cysteine desulfurase [Candidatus Calescibacterium sp.]MCX7734534.1 cysteine desulfurase [bacterium]MDW8087642.1 cysteine desulfurase family protein [Candidatus Calescibacterium sp.]
MQKRLVYLDYNSTTPISDEVAEEMLKYLSAGNPSSPHWSGREAREYLDSAREKIAKILQANLHEIVFNSGATEGNNNVIKGIAFYEIKRNRTPYIVSTKVEHSSVLRPLNFVVELGGKVELVNVDKYGIPDPDEFKKIIRKNGKPSLISVIHVNNETGVISPLEEIVKIAKEYDVPVHIDITQSVGKIRINLKELKVDFATFSGHKIYGPKGIGVMYVRIGSPLEPLMHGGRQEDGLRAGTQNVAGAAGIAKALELCEKEMEQEIRRLRKIQSVFENEIQKIWDVKINGHPEFRTPTTSNITFRGIEGETFLINLDLEGIAASMGSACSAESKTPSHVLLAMGLSEDDAKSSIRFSFGRFTTEDEIYYTIEKIKEILSRMKSRTK